MNSNEWYLYHMNVSKWYLEYANKGAGKTTYTFSANANVLSANFPFSMLPAGMGGMDQAAETESTLALAENIYVNLPTPCKQEGMILRYAHFQDLMRNNWEWIGKYHSWL